MKSNLLISAVWIRRTGASGDPAGKVELLVEHAGEWRLVATEYLASNFSHIVEAAGIEVAPVDPLTKP